MISTLIEKFQFGSHLTFYFNCISKFIKMLKSFFINIIKIINDCMSSRHAYFANNADMAHLFTDIELKNWNSSHVDNTPSPLISPSSFTLRSVPLQILKSINGCCVQTSRHHYVLARDNNGSSSHWCFKEKVSTFSVVPFFYLCILINIISCLYESSVNMNDHAYGGKTKIGYYYLFLSLDQEKL